MDTEPMVAARVHILYGAAEIAAYLTKPGMPQPSGASFIGSKGVIGALRSWARSTSSPKRTC